MGSPCDLTNTKSGPATRVPTLRLSGLPRCSLGALERGNAVSHSRMPPGAGLQKEGCGGPCSLDPWSGDGKDRLPGENDLVPGGGELDPKLDRVSGGGTQVFQGIYCKDIWPHFCWAPRLDAFWDPDPVRPRDPGGSPPGGGV